MPRREPDPEILRQFAQAAKHQTSGVAMPAGERVCESYPPGVNREGLVPEEPMGDPAARAMQGGEGIAGA